MASLGFYLANVSGVTEAGKLYTYRLKIMIEQHKLRRSEVWFALHGELVAPMSNLGTLHSLHYGADVGEETQTVWVMG